MPVPFLFLVIDDFEESPIFDADDLGVCLANIQQ